MKNHGKTNILYDFTCLFCGADLNKAVALLGEEAYNFHMDLHHRQLDKQEIIRLRAGIEVLRDGGYGCFDDAQAILDGEDSFLER